MKTRTPEVHPDEEESAARRAVEYLGETVDDTPEDAELSRQLRESVASAERNKQADRDRAAKRRRTFAINEAAGKHKPRERKVKDFSKVFGGR